MRFRSLQSPNIVNILTDLWILIQSLVGQNYVEQGYTGL